MRCGAWSRTGTAPTTACSPTSPPAACSREEALESAEAGGRVQAQVTTQAPRIADLVAKEKAGEPVTVYATYASLERIVQAHRDFGLPAWDLVVIDEAHRTAGSEGKAWAAVHHDADVPALRRLYFTATPRIADDRRAKDGLADLADADSDGVERLPALCSMDSEEIYGRTVLTWTLGQGIEHGYLADYRVLVPVVTDEDLRELLNLPAVADLRSQRSNEELLRLALQIAVLRAVADLGLRRVITFHSRVSAAREFANTLLEASELLPDAERPERIWAKAVAGTDRLKDRRAAFADFKAHTGEDGEECGILCNSRLLTEGIDVAAVDAICFADPKSSVIDIVQAVGRALRQSYREGKVSWVIIPVYLPTPEVGDDTATADPAEVHDAGEAVKAEADTEIEASSFRTIWRVLRVLRALAAHDARVVGRITELRGTRSQGAMHTTAAKPAEGEAAEAGGEGERQPAPVESPIEWLRINARQHAAQILQTVKLRAFNPRAVEWQRMHAVAGHRRALPHPHRHTGDLVRRGLPRPARRPLPRPPPTARHLRRAAHQLPRRPGTIRTRRAAPRPAPPGTPGHHHPARPLPGLRSGDAAGLQQPCPPLLHQLVWPPGLGAAAAGMAARPAAGPGHRRVTPRVPRCNGMSEAAWDAYVAFLPLVPGPGPPARSHPKPQDPQL
ncbi:helicase-related protein [Kitasatospora sp. NPDC097643]|uniref:helicase-related protein n=1 Tax=Kitasatospora sp. NPDC097643 TaxID=3157230 RepID=UPI003334A62C